EQAVIALDRTRNGLEAKSILLVGPRGVGKTVVLNLIHMLAREAGFYAAYLEAAEGKSLAELLAPALRQILYALTLRDSVSDSTRRALRVLRSFVAGQEHRVPSGRASSSTSEISLADLGREMAIDPEPGSASSGDLESDLTELLEAVAEAALDRKRSIALCLDELHFLPQREFAALTMALDRLAQRRLPLVLIAAGLPLARGLAGRSSSERLFDYPEIGPLNPADAALALEIPLRVHGVSFSPEALEAILEATHGYPYFLQQWGYEAWNSSEGPVIGLDDVHRATGLALRRLDRSFFRVRLDRLTRKERVYLRALAELGPGPQRSGRIAETLGVKIQSVAPVRDALLRKGMIFSPAYGETAFTTPLFDEFQRRILPTFP
ncbi:MAG: ATP-binding protein, partial [Terracidiphilus sp.]|nr:ATP-binding protein [Terracidiphilus sp.]